MSDAEAIAAMDAEAANDVSDVAEATETDEHEASSEPTDAADEAGAAEDADAPDEPSLAEDQGPAEDEGPAETPADEAMAVAAADTRKGLELYVLRHADAGDPMQWEGDDADRPLSGKGRRQSKRLGRLLEELGFKPDLIVTSPKLRAAETARIVARAIGARATTDERLASGFDTTTLRGLLDDGGLDARKVVIVGHDPDFSGLVSTLVGAQITMRKGALARIDLSDGVVEAGRGALRWLLPPDAIP